MTSNNLQQNQVAKNPQRIGVCYLVELSIEEWIEHGKLLCVGSAMADYLRLLPKSLLNPLAIGLLKMAQGENYSSNYEYAKNLAKCWFETVAPLRSAYEKAVAITV